MARKTTHLNVRMDEDLRRRVNAVAERFRISPSEVLRIILEKYVEDCERTNYRVVFPPEFKQFTIHEK